MADKERYDEAVLWLATHGYEVIPDVTGYIVRRSDNAEDVSHARHLVDLLDLAELFEWAAQRSMKHQHDQHLVSAKRLVVKGEHLVAEQTARVAKLTAGGQDTTAASAFLETLKQSLVVMYQFRQRIIDETAHKAT